MFLHVDELEARLHQFNKLMNELLRGRMARNTFQPWEVEILLDIEACALRDANRREMMRRYQRAANRYFERGGRTLLKLSEYLEKKHRLPLLNEEPEEESLPAVSDLRPRVDPR